MVRQVIDTTTDHGTYTGDPATTAFGKVNDNFQELYTAFTPSSKALAALVPAAKKFPIFTTPSAAELADISETGKSLVGAADGAAAIKALGGTSVGQSLLQSSSAAAARSAIGVSDFAARALIGTVSVASGVPTGAIIERVSNANGEAVRFADGYQVAVVSYQGSDAAGTVRNLTTPVAFVGGFTATGVGLSFIPSSSWQQGKLMPKAYMANSTTLALFFDAALENNRITAVITGRWY